MLFLVWYLSKITFYLMQNNNIQKIKIENMNSKFCYLSFFLLISFCFEIKAQKKFSIKIQFSKSVDNKNIQLKYDNGKDEIDVKPIIKNNSITITDIFYSKYATIIISYSNEKNNYYNSFWVSDKTAIISFTDNSKDEPLKKYKLTNAYDLKLMGEEKYAKFMAVEDKDFFDFIIKNNANMNDSLVQIAFKKGKIRSSRKLEFVKENGDLYYSFWLFRKEVAFCDTSINTLMNIYDKTFSTNFKKSIEGAEITKILNGRNLKKDSQAPTFITKDITGKIISLDNYKSKFVLLTFWASWCGPCVEEMPTIKAMRENYSLDKFEVISVTLDDDLAKFSEAAKKYNMNWKHIFGDKDLVKKYGVIGIPEIYLIDKTGKIIYKREEEKDYKLEYLTKLLSEKL